MFEMKVKDGKLVPVQAATCRSAITVVVPDSLDGAHFGHVFWKCCELLYKEASSDV